MCIYSLRNNNKRSTHVFTTQVKNTMLPGHQMALFYVFTVYYHGFDIFFSKIFLKISGQWLRQLSSSGILV